MKWPGKDVRMEDGVVAEWTNGVEQLLEIQEPELKARGEEKSENTNAQSATGPLGSRDHG